MPAYTCCASLEGPCTLHLCADHAHSSVAKGFVRLKDTADRGCLCVRVPQQVSGKALKTSDLSEGSNEFTTQAGTPITVTKR